MATSGALVLEIGLPSVGSGRLGRNGSNVSVRSTSQHVTSRKVYKKRDVSEFTADEVEHLENLKNNSLLQKLQVFSVFKGPTKQLQLWPQFFDASDDQHTYGNELQKGLIQLWSTFILLETLLTTCAIQPFITTQGLQSWKLTWYGLLWMMSLLVDWLSLATTAFFLGFLLSNPGKLTWIWLCKIGALRGIPAILVLFSTFMNFVAIGFTSFVLYGWKVGVVCVVFEVLIGIAASWIANFLGTTSTDVIEFELK